MGYVMLLLHLTTQVQSESRRIFGVCENVSVREANPADVQLLHARSFALMAPVGPSQVPKTQTLGSQWEGHFAAPARVSRHGSPTYTRSTPP
jgi:hypothetical protein